MSASCIQSQFLTFPIFHTGSASHSRLPLHFFYVLRCCSSAPAMASKKRSLHPDNMTLASPSLPKRLFSLSHSASCVDSPVPSAASFLEQDLEQHELEWNPGFYSLLSPATNLSSCDPKGSSPLAHPMEHYHVIHTKCSHPAHKSMTSDESRSLDHDALSQSSIDCETEGSDVTYEKNMKRHLGDPCSSISRGPDAEAYINTRMAGFKRDTSFLNSLSVSSQMTEGSSCDSYALPSRNIKSGHQKRFHIEDETPGCMAGSSSGELSDTFFTESRRSGRSLLNTYPSVSRGFSSNASANSAVLPLSSSPYEREHEMLHLEGAFNSGRTLPIEPQLSYVLSSGRLSLEEEARLGRRPPTIDQDFEDYFSSLML